MKTISKNVRTHNVLHGEKGEERIPVTTEQFEKIEKAKRELPSTTLWQIRDADSGDLVFYGELRKIRGFEERKTSAFGGASYYCDFGNSHPIWFSCECKEKYGVYPGVFRAKAFELFPNRRYIQDITNSERESTLIALRK